MVVTVLIMLSVLLTFTQIFIHNGKNTMPMKAEPGHSAGSPTGLKATCLSPIPQTKVGFRV